MNCRVVLNAFARSESSAARCGDFKYACACSALGHSEAPMRLGGSPVTAMIFPVAMTPGVPPAVRTAACAFGRCEPADGINAVRASRPKTRHISFPGQLAWTLREVARAKQGQSAEIGRESPVREREFRAERRERGREAAAHPGEHARTRDDVIAD